ncbi:hypothetical protein C8J57DRAFT_1248165 [Mycena rebaudengoi]|nr:hypothetical protein C8J57DRAFT_1248165 [Mycena rebaudengoi]
MLRLADGGATPPEVVPYMHRRVARVEDYLSEHHQTEGAAKLPAECQRGSRRVDHLLGQTFFAGLSSLIDEPDHCWQVELQIPPCHPVAGVVEQAESQGALNCLFPQLELRCDVGMAPTQDYLPILMKETVVAGFPKEKEEAVVASLPKEQGNPRVFPQDPLSSCEEAAALLLPAYFSTQNLVTSTVWSRLLGNIGRFTVSKSLEEASSDTDYERIQKQVHEEWLKVGGLLVGLAAVETAALALTPGFVFTIDTVSRITLFGSSISTGIGLLCDIYVFLRFSFAAIPAFKHRAQDNYEIRSNGSINRTESYVFFAFLARFPLLLAMISILFVAILLVDAAYKVSPFVVLSILGFMGFGLSRLLGWLVVGLLKAATWPLSAFKYVAENTWR